MLTDVGFRPAVGVMRTVRGVVQVVGHHNVPVTPMDLPQLRKWYYEVSISVELSLLPA